MADFVEPPTSAPGRHEPALGGPALRREIRLGVLSFADRRRRTEFRSGLATFTLDPGRMGDPALEVSLAEPSRFETAKLTDRDGGSSPIFTGTLSKRSVPVVLKLQGPAADNRVGADEVAGEPRPAELHHMPIEVPP